MKIKLHNSMSKVDAGRKNIYLFDEKINVDLTGDNLYLYYEIESCFSLLEFSPETKKFRKQSGFGQRTKMNIPGWWKDHIWRWKEMSE